MGDIHHGRAQLVVNFLKLAAQNPFQMRVNHRQRFVKQNGRNIITHQTTPQRDRLFFIRAKAACLLLELACQIQHPGNFTHTGINALFINATVAQGEGQVVIDRHGVIDHRELENLCDVAFFRGKVCNILAIKQDLTV